MRDVVDPRTASPDVGLAWHADRLGRYRGVPEPRDEESGAERLRRRDQVVHRMEIAYRLRRQRRAAIRPA